MDFFKLKRFRKHHVLNVEKDPEDIHTSSNNQAPTDESRNENGDALPKATDAVDSTGEMDEDDDDDFITNEVKRRLKELRRNSFMVLIPEESYPEEDSNSCEFMESEVDEGYPWSGFDYNKYCERMLFFDKMIAQVLPEAVTQGPSNPSPRSASKKLASTLRNLSFKRRDELQDDAEHLQQQQEHQDDPYIDLETAYVAQICLTWEALNCQYLHLSQIIFSQPDIPTCYSHAAQQFQQFQVLLQRFIENEPFEQGNRVESYGRTKSSLPKLLKVPCFQDRDQEEKEKEDLDLPPPVLAGDLSKVIESSILTFRLFLKMDKKKTGNGLHIFGGSQAANSLQQIQASIHKKEMKLKELARKKKGWKKKSWPATLEEVELLFGLTEIKVVLRVLRMVRVSKEQLLWCEEKMNKLNISESKLHRDGPSVLFPS